MMFSRNLLCAGIILISHGAYAMDKGNEPSRKRDWSSDSGDGMPGKVLKKHALPIHQLKALIDAQPNTQEESQKVSTDAIGSTMVKTEHLFRKKPLGITPMFENDKVIMYKVKNEACQEKGILPGCQLLSVNGTPVTDMEHALQLVTDASLPIKMVFMCPKVVKKEFTFREGKLGFDVEDKANKVMVTRVTNEYLDRGIFPGCQLLSVNGERVTDRKSTLQLLKSTSPPFKFVFMCPQNTPFKYTKKGREILRQKMRELEEGMAKLKEHEESMALQAKVDAELKKNREPTWKCSTPEQQRKKRTDFSNFCKAAVYHNVRDYNAGRF